MTDFTTLERELMAKVRGAIEPSIADQSRLRAQLAAKVALLSASLPPTPVASLPTHPLRHLVHSHLIALGTVAASAALIAFGAGYAVGRRSQPPSVKTIVVSAPAAKLEAMSAPLAAEPEPNPASLSSFSDLGHSDTRTRVAPKGVTSAGPPDNSLTEELDLLKRAERMIRANNPMVAIGLLSELDHKFPKGQLLEERTAVRAMANCQLVDEDSARLQGQAYLSTHSQSVYVERVRAICHLDFANSAKDSPAPGTKHLKENQP